MLDVKGEQVTRFLVSPEPGDDPIVVIFGMQKKIPDYITLTVRDGVKYSITRNGETYGHCGTITMTYKNKTYEYILSYDIEPSLITVGHINGDDRSEERR